MGGGAATGLGLAGAHRLAQTRLGVGVVAQQLLAWRLLDIADLDATTPGWLSVATPLVAGARAQSAALGASYYRTSRVAAIGADFAPVLADAANLNQIQTSLTVSGPVATKVAVRAGHDLATASDIGAAGAAGEAMRLALDGGRETIIETVAADREAVGWARVGSDRPCAFCAMLISRGPVYKAKWTANFKPHGRCACEPEVVWERGRWEHRYQYEQYAELWNRSTPGTSGRASINAFRRAHERNLRAAT